MRKAQDRMHAARPYGDKIRVICSHLARANVTDYSHPFLTSPEGAKKVGIILVSTDKGLAGASTPTFSACFCSVSVIGLLRVCR